MKTMISMYGDGTKRDEYLAELQFAFNTADATGYSPAFLNHGRELRIRAPRSASAVERTTTTTQRGI